MPRLVSNDDLMMDNAITGMSAFKFSATKIEKLGATEYTLVSFVVDTTGSTGGFENKLRECLITAIKSCKKSPRSDNLLARVILFSTSYHGGIQEIHGFKPLSEIDPDNDYPNFVSSGGTPLYDATFSAIGATNTYSEQLMNNDFLTNGIVFIITDGCESHGSSVATPLMIENETKKAVLGEHIESLITILIGINDQTCSQELQSFKQHAGINQYIGMGDVTDGKLAKLAGFVSQSVSSVSQSLGTGGPSQNISATI
jgi:uncharacterized protein YegL